MEGKVARSVEILNKLKETLSQIVTLLLYYALAIGGHESVNR